MHGLAISISASGLAAESESEAARSQPRRVAGSRKSQRAKTGVLKPPCVLKRRGLRSSLSRATWIYLIRHAWRSKRTLL